MYIYSAFFQIKGEKKKKTVSLCEIKINLSILTFIIKNKVFPADVLFWDILWRQFDIFG